MNKILRLMCLLFLNQQSQAAVLLEAKHNKLQDTVELTLATNRACAKPEYSLKLRFAGRSAVGPYFYDLIETSDEKIECSSYEIVYQTIKPEDLKLESIRGMIQISNENKDISFCFKSSMCE